MHQREAINYVTVEELEKDFESLTGDKESAKAQVKLFAIRYRGEIIDSVRYQKGLISKDDLQLSKHIRWQHHKNHSQRLAANMLAASRKRPANTAAHHIVSWDHPRAAKARIRLAAFGIDIDHEANGVYLPRFKKHIPHANR
ncbi:AHH domain-containing protein, partial [Vibrio vulnificus]